MVLVQFVHYSEGLQELGEVDAAVLVEVDASRQGVDCPVVEGDAQVTAEETPGVAELVQGDKTWTWICTNNEYLETHLNKVLVIPATGGFEMSGCTSDLNDLCL